MPLHLQHIALEEKEEEEKEEEIVVKGKGPKNCQKSLHSECWHSCYLLLWEKSSFSAWFTCCSPQLIWGVVLPPKKESFDGQEKTMGCVSHTNYISTYFGKDIVQSWYWLYVSEVDI